MVSPSRERVTFVSTNPTRFELASGLAQEPTFKLGVKLFKSKLLPD